MKSIFSILILITLLCLGSQSYADEEGILPENLGADSNLTTESPQILRRSPSPSLIAPGNREDLQDPPPPLRRSPSQSLIAPGNRSDLSKPPQSLRRFPPKELIAPGNR